MSNKINDIKDKVQKQKEGQERKKKERDARNELYTANENTLKGEDQFTVTIDKLVLELKNPEQTFGTKLDRTEHVACFMEPEVKEALMKEQNEKGRGWKSHLVNELVKKYYQDKGSL